MSSIAEQVAAAYPDSTAKTTPSAQAQSAVTSKTFVSPEGELYKSNSVEESARFQAMGYQIPTAADFKRSHIKSIYSRDYSAGEAAAYGAIEGIPFLGSAITATKNFVEPGAGDAFVAQSQLAQEQHPYVAGAAQLATGTAAFIATEGAAGAVLPQLQGSSAVASVANAAIKSGAASAIVGTASRADMAIMQHISGMGGEEKLFAHLGYGALADAAIGAAIPVGLAGLGKATRSAAKAFETAGESLGNTEGRKAVLAMKDIQTAYDSARATDVHQVFTERGFNEKTVGAVKTAIKDELPKLEAQYNNLKATVDNKLTTAEGSALRDTLSQALESSPEIRSDVLRRRLAVPEQGLKDLHELRLELDSKINYKADKPTQQDMALFQARQEVGTAIRTLLRESDVAFGGAQAERWVKLDRDYSAFKVMDDVLQEAPKQGLAGVIDKADKNLANMHLVSRLFPMVGGFTAGAFHGAVKVAQKAMESDAVAKSARFVSSKILNPAAERMTTAVESGLYGVARDAAISLGVQTLNAADFDNRYAQVQWSAANPDKAVSNITTALTTQGADVNLAGQMAMRAQMANQYLAENAPARTPGNRIVAAPPGIPAQHKREWLSLYQTINDPTHGILHPSERNIKAMEKFYPEQLAATREAILSQIQNTPSLPMASRMYASRVLRMPVDNLTSGYLAKVVAQGEAEQEQQAQQQSGAQSRSQLGSSTAGGSSNATRMQRLQED